MSADARVRSFIDRILVCREAEDAAKDDTKAVYAEAAGEGYDKAAMGALVRELRTKGKNPAKFEEKATILDLYRDAYERASHVHVREGSQESQRVDSKAAIGLTEPALTQGSSLPANTKSVTIPHSPQPLHSRQEAIAGTVPPQAVPAPIPSLQSVPPLATAKAPDVGSSPASGAPLSDSEVPAFLTKPVKPLRPHCLRPDVCGGVGARHCHSCTQAMGEAA